MVDLRDLSITDHPEVVEDEDVPGVTEGPLQVVGQLLLGLDPSSLESVAGGAVLTVLEDHVRDGTERCSR